MNGLQLIATGGALPGRTVTNEDLSRVVDTSDEWITTRTGIRTRHWCTEGESAATLAIAAARQALETAIAGVEQCTGTVEISGMTGELTSQLSSGLSIKIYGSDVNTLTALSEKVVDIVNSTPGFANATNGLGAGDSTIILKVDRDKVRAYGLTVAEVYQRSPSGSPPPPRPRPPSR